MPAAPLKILVVEDNGADLLLLRAALEIDPLDIFVLTSAERLSDGLELLRQGAFDLALLDLSLPDSQGLETFTAFQRQASDLPVVVFSGNTDEQEAIRAVRAGAQDYLVKSQNTFGVAARTIRHAIERYKLAKSLQESERRFSIAFHSSPIPQIVSKASSNQIVDANNACCQILGCQLENLIGRSTVELGLWADPVERETLVRTLQTEGRIRDVEVEFRLPSGEIRTMVASIEPIELAGEQCLISTALDITERKQAEEQLRESEKKFRSFVESSSEGITLVDEQGVVIEWNPAREKMTGLPASQILGQKLWDVQYQMVLPNLQTPEFYERYRQALLNALQTGQSPLFGRVLEAEVMHPDRPPQFIQQTIFPIKTDKGYRVGSVTSDITERKRVETALTHRLAELELLYQSGLALSSELEPRQIAGKLIEALEKKMNWHHVTIRRYEPESDRLELLAFNQPGIENEAQRQAVEKRFNELVPNSSRGLSGWAVRNGQVVRSGDVRADDRYTDTHPGIRSGLYAPMLLGERVVGVVSVESEALNAFSESDERLLTTIANQAAIAFENARLFQNLERELTERKQAEAKLRESEARYRGIFNSVRDAIFLEDQDGNILDVNQPACKMFGYRREEFVGKNVLEIVPQKENFITLAEIENGTASGPAIETVNMRANGEQFPVELSGSSFEFGGQKLFLAVVHDITRRKQAEDELRESEERYRTVANFTYDWEYWVDPKRQFVYISPSCERITGYSPETFRAKPHLMRDIIHPEDRSNVRKHMELEFSQEETASLDYRIITANGEVRWINHVCRSVHGADGSWLGRRASNRDITDRKQAEQQLLELQEFSAATIDALAAHLCVLDENGVVISINQAWQEFATANPPTHEYHFLGMNYLTVCDNAQGEGAEMAAAVAQGIRAVMAGEIEHFQIEYPCHSPWEQRWFIVKVTRFTQNGAVRIAMAHENITERKQAEEKARQSHDQLLKFAAQVPGMLYQFELRPDGTMCVPFSTEAIRDIYGCTPEDVRDDFSPIATVIHPEDFPLINEKIIQSAQSLSPFRAEYRVLLPQQPERWILAQSAPERLADGRIVWSGFNTDITENKRAEEKLLESEARFKSIFNTSPVRVAITRLNDTMFLDVNDGFLASTGYSREEVVGHTSVELGDWIDPEERLRLHQMVVGQPPIWNYEARLRQKSGDIRAVLISADMVELFGERCILSVGLDITERKRTEMERETILEIMQGLAFSKSMEEFLSLVHYSIGRFLRADNFFVALYDAASETFNYVYWEDQYDLPTPSSVYEKTFTAYIFRTRVPFLHTLERSAALIASGEVELVGSNSLSFLGVPLIVSGQSIGVMVVQDYKDADLYSEHDLQVMMSIAGQVAQAVQRRRSEAALQLSEERYRSLVDQIPAVVYADDLAGKTQFISPQIELLLGYIPAEWLEGGSALWQASIHPDEREQVAAEYMDCIQNKVPFFREYRLRRKDDGYVWVQDQFTILHEEKAASSLVHGLVYDITARKQAEQELREANERFSQLANNVTDIFWISEPVKRRNLYTSPAFTTVIGRTPEDVARLPNRLLDVVVPEDHPVLRRACEQEDNGFKTDVEYRIQRPDGEIRWIRDKGAPVFDDNGKVVRIVGVATDITELHQAETALRESEANYRLLFELVPDGIIIHDGQQIVFANPAAAKLMGAEDREILIGKKLMDFVHPDSRPLVIERIKNQETNGNPLSPAEEKFLRMDGSVVYVEVSAAPVTRREGGTFLVTIHNITERKQTEFETAYRQQLLEKVIQLGKNITAITDLDTCLRQIHHSVRHNLGFDRVGIFLYDATNRIIQGTYGTSRSGEMESNSWYRQPVEEWTDWQIALQSSTGMSIDKDYQAARNPSPDNEMYGVKEHVTLAAWAGEKPVALLAVDNFVSHRKIVTADLEALQLFAGYIGLAIANAQLHAGLEQRIKARTEEVQDLYDNAPTGYHSLDVNGCIVMINQTELGWLGYTREELIGQPYSTLLTPSSQAAFEINFPIFKQRGWVRDLEFEIIRKDGSTFPVLVNETAIKDESGHYLMSRSTVFDITELKKAENALRASEARLNFLLSQTPAMIFTSRMEENFPVSFISDSVRQILGYEPRQYTENPGFWQSVTHPEDQVNGMRAIQELLQTGHSIWESRVKCLDGLYRWMSTGTNLVRDENGQPVEVIGYSVNIDEQKKAQQALRESEETYRALFETANDAIFLMDIKSRAYMRVNPRSPELLGVDSAEELIGRDSREFIEPSQWEDSEERLWRLFAGERLLPYERTFIRADGARVEVEINLSLIRDGLGKPKFIQGVVRDITQRKQAAETLQHANLELERAMRMKDEFLASMSHELRTPLTGILGLSEALQMKTYGELSEKQLKALKNIESSGRHLLELINDILDLSKIEAGKLDMHLEPSLLGDVCQASLQLTKGLAGQKRQNVSYASNPASIVILADARRLKQMLVNLLSNAIKFTPEGGQLGLEVECLQGEGVVKLTVWDKGIGIASGNIQHLFKPFVQLDSSLARQHAGTGLGLSLVQRMAELHGGSVQVESTLGEGSRFTIALPWVPHATLTNPAALQPANPLRHSLTVDDNEIDAERISRYLESLGIGNSVYPTGEGAVDVAVSLNPGIILLDLNLPDIPGFEVLSRLKSEPRTRSIPVIICSVEDSRNVAQALGASGYLLKPFTLPEMRAELSRVVNQQKFPESVLTIAPRHTAPTVLIVDDNEVTLETVSDFLTTRHFRVLTARSGMEFLNIVAETHADIILMDIQMPGMDGLEATRRLRAFADQHVARIPVIAMTALAMPGDRELCLNAGADEYLSKPIQLQNLISTLQRIILLRHSQEK